MFALPHHIASMDQSASASSTGLRLMTTTKGMAVGVLADRWTMVESNLPVGMSFAPFDSSGRSIASLSSAAISAINSIADSEINQDYNSQCCLDSMYFSGKGLAKLAMMIYVLNDLVGNKTLAQTGLAKLKTCMAVFVGNKQKNPLVYEQAWGGIVSTAGYSDAGADFGGTYYNDHHFHYGYFVYTAAVIAHLDPAWLTQGSNKAWVNMLVRDFANPVSDSLFPFSRSFDWFQGHSWAKGLFESADGKDQESTSEDAFASFGLKMWGLKSGDKNTEARGNLMLAIQARTFQSYFLMDSKNSNQPVDFINNKVTGILFENKVDHATYFSNNIECIQGIHMIPLAPPSALVRSRNFGEISNLSVSAALPIRNALNMGFAAAEYATISLMHDTRSLRRMVDLLQQRSRRQRRRGLARHLVLQPRHH